MASAKKTKIAFGSMAVAFLFLFNPNFIIIDFLPDFVGYMLLCHALVFFADLNESAASALSSFRKMISVDIGKFLAIFWIFSMPSTKEQNSSMLLWSFVFSVLELLLLIPAYSKLFEGLTQLGNFHPNSSVHGAGKGKKSNTDRLRRFTLVFVVCRSVLSVLPELLDLSQVSEFESGSHIDLYQYVGLLRAAVFLPLLIAGFVWLGKMWRYWYRIAKDRSFVESLKQTYAERVAPKIGLFAKRNLRLAFWLLFFASLALVDFRLDQINMIPDSVAAVLFLAFFVTVSRSVKLPKPVFLVSALYLMVTAASDVLDYIFNAYYNYSVTLKAGALTVYTYASALRVASLLALLALVWCVAKAMLAVIRDHTGSPLGISEQTDAHGLTAEYRKELSMKLIPPALCVGLYAIADLLTVFEPVISSYYERSFAIFHTVAMLTVMILALATYLAKEAVWDGVQSRYMLE